MIPRTIHYCWFGGNPLSELDEKCIASWKTYCPDYRIVRWDESNIDIGRNRYAAEAHQSRMWAFVSDYARLYVVYEHGGVYLDTDVELLKSIDPLLDYSGFMGFESEAIVAPGLGFGAARHNRLIYDIMQYYDNRAFIGKDGGYDLTTIPKITTQLLVQKGMAANNTMQTIEDVTLLPTEYLCPKVHATGDIVITDNTYAIHHFAGSWKTEAQKAWIERKRMHRRLFGGWLGKRVSKLERAIMNLKRYYMAAIRRRR